MALKEEVQKAAETLRAGGIILYPTDTIWGIGCDATNPDAVARIYAIKKRKESKSMIVLVHNDSMLNNHIKEVPSNAWDIIDYSEKPTTIIYEDPSRVAGNLLAEDGSLGVRMIRDQFCQQLIGRFGKPIVSTSANISGTPFNGSFQDIDPSILKEVDYVVNLRQQERLKATPSSIIKINLDGTFKIIRK